MNSTTTNYAVPRLSTVLTVGSFWLTAFTAILVFHLTSVASTEEFVTTLIVTIGVAFATAVTVRAAVSIWRCEQCDRFAEPQPDFRPSLGANKAKAA